MTKKRKRDFELNQVMILEAFLKLLNDKSRKPTLEEISNETGLSMKTIDRHMKELSYDKYICDLKALTVNVMMGFYNKAKEGKAPEVKLWMQIVENWKETTGINHSGEIKFEKINFVMQE
jgi:predicted transcriptional regulator